MKREPLTLYDMGFSEATLHAIKSILNSFSKKTAIAILQDLLRYYKARKK